MSEGFDAVYLPSDVKEDLCRDLLAELGVTRISKAGDELKVRCVMPWHNDRNPSASLNYEKMVYGCWSCGSSGGFLWLISACLGTDGSAARSWVDARSGLGDGDEFSLSTFLSFLDAIAEGGAGRSGTTIPRFSPQAIEEWSKIVHPILTEGLPEFGITGRGIPEQNLRDMRVGYDPEYPIDAHGVTSERIIIPHFWKGDLVGWQSRRVWDDGTPKYLSTGEMPKDVTLYDFDVSRGTAVVVESPMSVLRHRHHVPMTATFGASVTDRQVRLLSEFDRVVLWFDNDLAGWKATMSVGQRLEAYTMVEAVESPWAADPADMDDETAESLVSSAVPFALWNSPQHLLCWVCKKHHRGKCQEGGE